MARPAEYNIELCKEICDEVANGRNIKEVLNSKEEYPTWTSFRRWKNENQELSTLYIKAIQDKAEMVDSEIDAIMNDLKEKIYDPATANVLIQTLKWKAAKYYPKMFGEASKVTLEGNIDIKTKTDYSSYSTEDLKAIEEISKKYDKKDS